MHPTYARALHPLNVTQNISRPPLPPLGRTVVRTPKAKTKTGSQDFLSFSFLSSGLISTDTTQRSQGFRPNEKMKGARPPDKRLDRRTHTSYEVCIVYISAGERTRTM